jgi:hypothetical protein
MRAYAPAAGRGSEELQPPGNCDRVAAAVRPNGLGQACDAFLSGPVALPLGRR